ncbi:hypothetical protein GCM10028868_21470 [Virgibacillus kimchii]
MFRASGQLEAYSVDALLVAEVLPLNYTRMVLYYIQLESLMTKFRSIPVRSLAMQQVVNSCFSEITVSIIASHLTEINRFFHFFRQK